MAKPRRKKGKKKKKLSKEELEALQRAEAERLWTEEQERLVAQKNKNEVEFRLRGQQLTDSMLKFQSIKSEVETKKSIEKTEAEWLKYLHPTELPPGDSPPNIRKFLYRLRQEELKDVANLIDYRFKVNERCMLTQDDRIEDVTMKRLTKLHNNPGVRFAQRIQALMSVLEALEAVLKDNITYPKHIIEDLYDLKRDIRQLIEEQLSKFSLHVLANINQEMQKLDPWRSDYEYSDSLLQSHFWSYRDPLPPTTHVKGTEVKLSNVNITATIPPELDLKQASLAGFWLHFDHYTDTLENFEKSGAPAQTLLAVTQAEFARREDMASAKLVQMRAARAEYDEKCRQAALLAAADNKRGKKGDKKEAPKKKKKKKGKKTPVEIIPPIVDETTLVDVENDMKTELDEKFMEFKRNLGPKFLHKFEINIREFEITTGIFHLRCFEKLWQPKEYENHLTVDLVKMPHELVPKPFHQPYDPNPLGNPLPRLTLADHSAPKSLSVFRSLSLTPAPKQNSEEIEAAIEENEMKLRKLIHVTLKLPANVFWWEEPAVGCWVEETPDVHKVETLVTKSQPCEVISDFILSKIPDKVEINKLIPEQIIPRIPENYKFHSELAADFENSKKLLKKQAKFGGEDVKSSKSKNPDTTQFKTPPRDLFPAPVRIPRLNITDRITEIPEPECRPSIDEDDEEPFPEEPDTTLAEFVKSLVPLRAKEQPYFRNLSQIALFEEEEENVEKTQMNVPMATAQDSIPSFLNGSSDGELQFSEPRQKRMWSKENVHCQFYDAEKKVLSFYLSSFCTFAVTNRKYCHFPLKSWKLTPSERNSVLLTLVTQLMTVEIVVTTKGFTMNLLEPRKTFFKPISQSLKLDAFIVNAKRLNLNVFTDDDASFYVEGASLKLPTLEQHTYHCMSCFCSTHEFHSSIWNRFSNYRTICVATRPAVEAAMTQEIMVTAERAEFVEIEEGSTELESEDVELEFRRTPEIQEYKADLYNLLLSDDSWNLPRRKILRQTPAQLQFNVLQLLQSIHPFSFS